MVSKTRNSLIDLTKFFMALSILALHSQAFGRYNYLLSPIYRIGVPFFFIISSYFFFSKLQATSSEQKTALLLKYIWRNLTLYIFWFLLSFPFVARERYSIYFQKAFWDNIKYTLTRLLFSSTWMASWYIMATVLGTLIIYLLSQKFKNNTLFIACLLINILCCLCSNYYGLFDDTSIIHIIADKYQRYFNGAVYNSFPVGLLWIIIGKIFAESPIKPCKSRWFIISFLLLAIENFLAYTLKYQYASDSMLMLIPVAITGTSLLLNAKNTIKCPDFFRIASVVIFCSQGISITLLNKFLMYNNITITTKISLCKFIIAAASCLILTKAIIIAEKNSKLKKILKYSH